MKISQLHPEVWPVGHCKFSDEEILRFLSAWVVYYFSSGNDAKLLLPVANNFKMFKQNQAYNTLIFTDLEITTTILVPE